MEKEKNEHLEKSQELYQAHKNAVYLRTDKLFRIILVLQWILGIVFAAIVSPKTWYGAEGYTHIHIYAAVIAGGLLAAFPIIMTYVRPGQAITRHTIACCQMLVSALFIHLTGGRIETHFHIFGSLAFLAMYRDIGVIITATVVVAGDHFLRGLYWPQSVFGVITASQWRWLEHAAWVLFEDVFLLFSIQQSQKEMEYVAERQMSMEIINETLKNQVNNASNELTSYMHNINSAMKEVVSSILEISQKTSNAVEISNDTLENSETTKAVIQKLDKDSQEINEITKIVTSIANQTNILALNASIEAMRAGEAGRSFTVVATEVKNLAKQTKQLASKISDKLSRLQEQLNIALDSITNTTSSVKTINDNSEQIAWSINVQEELNQEIFQSVGNADKQLSLLSENIAKMKENMANTANNQL